MTRELQVWGERNFKVAVPDDAKVTFGPWSPPNSSGSPSRFGPERGGTLRIYKGTKATENVIAVFSGVAGFRDTSLAYEELEHEPEPPTLVMPVSYGGMDADQKEELARLAADIIMERTLEAAAEAEDDDDSEPPF